MYRSFKILGALLSYPDAAIQEAAPHFKAIMAEEGIIPEGQQMRLGHLIDELATRDLYDLQERYVGLFDRSSALSLHLFEHVHGEGRDRGQAMVDLKQIYADNGLEISAKELPDFLPLFLEFLSTLPLEEARTMLGEPRHVLEAIRDRLRKRKTIYASVFRALVSVAADNAAAETGDIQTADNDPSDLEALDKAWAEDAIEFGPGEQGCPVADDMVARLKVPPADTPAVNAMGENA
ncbi:MAG: nitrate reductase molybdenum cofactor assembly chaperone [Maricaulis sp.]|jgi:nitrate reductase delta subunit|nr:nitrate reductase molybdenum cofactor assembly chaperone [Maricaulis sp.]MDG2044440.1 nitrate reductase molybdenum cofactor assembly chaperone [Maricaulis sp.]